MSPLFAASMTCRFALKSSHRVRPNLQNVSPPPPLFEVPTESAQTAKHADAESIRLPAEGGAIEEAKGKRFTQRAGQRLKLGVDDVTHSSIERTMTELGWQLDTKHLEQASDLVFQIDTFT